MCLARRARRLLEVGVFGREVRGNRREGSSPLAQGDSLGELAVARGSALAEGPGRRRRRGGIAEFCYWELRLARFYSEVSISMQAFAIFPNNDAGIKGSSRLKESTGACGFYTRPLPPSMSVSIFCIRLTK